MKTFSNKLLFAKNFAIRFVLFYLVFIAIDLYIPIKQLVCGKLLSLQEWVSYIHWLRHIPLLLVLTLLFSYQDTKKAKAPEKCE